MFQFRVPRFIFGIDSVKQIGDECKKFNSKKVLIVTDKGIISAGLLDEIKNPLAASGIDMIVFDEVMPNPRAESAKRGSNIYRGEKCDLIIGFGGGSSLDTAKGIALLATNKGSLVDYAGEGGKQAVNLPARYIAVPTTAGTGSELRNVAIITDEKTKRKFAIYQKDLLPVLTIIDPKLTVKMPPKVTANTGADALSHAIEAYYSTSSNPITDIFALDALNLISENLREVFVKGENLQARYNMMLGNTFAGIALGAGVGLAHAVAEGVGSLYDLPHGLLCGLFLPHAMKFNLIANPPKFKKIAESLNLKTEGLSNTEAGERAIDSVKEILENIKIPLKLREVGVEKDKFLTIAGEAMKNKVVLRWNPRKTTQEDVIKILEESY